MSFKHVGYGDTLDRYYYCDGCNCTIGGERLLDMPNHHKVEHHADHLHEVVSEKNRHTGISYTDGYDLCDRCHKRLTELQEAEKKRENTCPKCKYQVEIVWD